MKNVSKIIVGVGFVMSLQTLFAVGTVAGTSVSNTATATYQVSAITQTPVTSLAATFVVDRKVNFTLDKDDGAIVTVTPGQTGAVLKYKLTNLGNDTQDFGFTITDQASAATTEFASTDNFNPSAEAVFVDSAGNDGIYTAGTDTATYVDELAPGGVKEIFVVSTISLTQLNNDIAGVKLEAQAEVGGAGGSQGIAQANDAASADVAGTVQTVWADGASAGQVVNDSSTPDGKDFAYDAYKVVSSSLTVSKISTVISDPINGSTNPKRIPGAVVEYEISVANAAGAGAAATSVQVKDAIPAQTTYSAGTIFVDVTGSYVADDDGTTSALADWNVTTAGNITFNPGSISAGVTRKVKFRVTVN